MEILILYNKTVILWFNSWHINHYWLFNAKCSLYIYIKYIWFGLVGFFMAYEPLYAKSLYTYIRYIGYLPESERNSATGVRTRVLRVHRFNHYITRTPPINHCRLLNVKSLCIYIRYIWFGFFGFYSIQIIVGYLIQNPLYTYISKIYLVKLGFIAYQPLLVF